MTTNPDTVKMPLSELVERLRLIEGQYMGAGGNLRDSEVVGSMRQMLTELIHELDPPPLTAEQKLEAIRQAVDKCFTDPKMTMGSLIETLIAILGSQSDE